MSKVREQRIGIIMNGVTGRMGTNQHLLRSIAAIRKQGGLKISDDLVIMPDPILVGRNEAKLAALAARAEVDRYTTDLDKALADDSNEIYFDAQLTQLRAPAVSALTKPTSFIPKQKKPTCAKVWFKTNSFCQVCLNSNG
jgi:predicted dehydrogenase